MELIKSTIIPTVRSLFVISAIVTIIGIRFVETRAYAFAD
tara:strand:- start:560 stop:679 length:120 start_codon:yes stop_codon:yes gene_type:complete